MAPPDGSRHFTDDSGVEMAIRENPVEFRGVWVRKGRAVLLRDLSLDFQPAGVIGIVGGADLAGRVLSSLILGFGAPSEGTVRVFGQNPGHWSMKEKVSGVLPEMAPPLFPPDLLVYEKGRRLGLPPDVLNPRFVEIRQAFGLTGTGFAGASCPVAAQIAFRTLMALALISRPSVLIIDESDPRAQPSVLTSFWQYWEAIRAPSALTLVLSPSSPPALSSCTRRLTFADGGLSEDEAVPAAGGSG